MLEDDSKQPLSTDDIPPRKAVTSSESPDASPVDSTAIEQESEEADAKPEMQEEKISKTLEALESSEVSETLKTPEMPETLETLKSSEMSEAEETILEVVPRRKRVVRACKRIAKAISVPHIIIRAVGCYFMVMACFLFLNRAELKTGTLSPIDKWQEFIEKLPLKPFLLCILSGFVVLSLLRFLLRKIFHTRCEPDCFALLVGIVAMSFLTIWKTNNFYYTMAFVLVCAVTAWFCYRYGAFRAIEKLPRAVIYIIVAVLMCLIGAFIAVFTIYRHKVYGSMAFDFGIFVQMYHYMAETFTPMTTCERSELLSHFAVHFSPIYYLLLPFYYIFPSPYTLLIGQAVLVATGVIPLVGICRKQKFSNLATLCFSVVYLFCVELIAPCFYDFHENAFLPPLFMWFFYAVEKRKYILMYCMLALLLIVKEDVPVYMILIGIYCIFRMEKRYHGAIIAGVSGIYFVVVSKLMEKYGEGVMTSRTYGNLMTDPDASFGNIVKTVLMDPMYFITQCVDEKDFRALLIIMIPLAFLPFVTKHFSHYFLIAPFLLMNLASGYGYANEYGFQYVFGTATCLIYAAVINYAELKGKRKEYLPVFMSITSLLLFSSLLGGNVGSRESYYNNKEKFDTKDALLASIPDDASVACDSFLLPHVAQRDEVYIMDNFDAEKSSFTDFVVIRTELNNDWHASELNKLQTEGYVYFNGAADVIDIYVSPEYVADHPQLELAVKNY